MDEYETGMDKLNARGCEEVEIQLIDGEGYQVDLAKVAEIDQVTVSIWFETLENLDEQDVTQLCSLLDRNFDLDEALRCYDEVCIFHGTAAEYAQELTEDITDIPESLRFYIDYEAMARDMGYNGEIEEITHNVIVTNLHDF